MAITLNHTIIPARDKESTARFFADIFGLKVGHAGHFAAVRVNETLTFDFDDATRFEPHHYAFQVSEAEFDEILDRAKAAGIAYSADPFHEKVGEINRRGGGRGFYFLDPNRHNLEVLTRA